MPESREGCKPECPAGFHLHVVDGRGGWAPADPSDVNDSLRHSDTDLLAAATRFSFGKVGSQNPHKQIDVEVRRNAFEPGTWWIVACFGWTYCEAEDCWLYEPIPGERTEQYVAATRYPDLRKAVGIAQRLLADGHPHTGPWTRRRLDD